MSDNIVDLAAKRKPVRYSIHVDHYYDGRIEVCFEGVTNTPTLRDKEALLAAIDEAKRQVEYDIDQHKQRDADAGRPCDT